MLDGYVTFDELIFITGLDKTQLNKIIKDGVDFNELDYTPRQVNIGNIRNVRKVYFRLAQVIKWMSVHIF